MKTIFAVIFALCVLNASVSAGSTASCKAVVQAVKENLNTFYTAGKQMEESQAMTAEYQKKFDGAAYQVFEAVSLGCGGLSESQYTSIAQSILSSPAQCKQYAGMFVGQSIEGIKNGETEEGAWDALFQYSEMCEA